MNPKLLEIIIEFAKQYNIDWRILYAILKKESDAKGFDTKGKLKTRFEKHIYDGFSKVFAGAKQHPLLPGLKSEWIKLHSATQIEFLSTSYGIAQIMGYWYPLLNYKSIDLLIESWTTSEEIQVRDFCLFCVRYNEGKFLDALKKLDFISIAKQYNGAGFKKNNYDTDLIKFVNGAKR